MLHSTGDRWHWTYDRWHVTHDTWCGVNILSKFQLSSSNPASPPCSAVSPVLRMVSWMGHPPCSACYPCPACSFWTFCSFCSFWTFWTQILPRLLSLPSLLSLQSLPSQPRLVSLPDLVFPKPSWQCFMKISDADADADRFWFLLNTRTLYGFCIRLPHQVQYRSMDARRGWVNVV